MKTFSMLLKREFWEHRGSWLLAPLVIGAVMQVLCAAFLLFRPTRAGGVAPDEIARVQDVLEVTRFSGLIPFFVIQCFVVLIYSVGALHDDRRDRSVLFWRSMPVSDTMTVLSKLTSALVIVPVIMIGLSLLFVVCLQLQTLLILTAKGSMSWSGMLELMLHGGVFSWVSNVALLIPLNALWAAPAVAWLLLVSAWARRAPFLWAIGVPGLITALLWWLEKSTTRDLGFGWIMENVMDRWSGFIPLHPLPDVNMAINRLQGKGSAFNDGFTFDLVLTRYQEKLSDPTFWLGVLLGVAMIALAVRLRRWRADAP